MITILLCQMHNTALGHSTQSNIIEKQDFQVNNIDLGILLMPPQLISQKFLTLFHIIKSCLNYQNMLLIALPGIGSVISLAIEL